MGMGMGVGVGVGVGCLWVGYALDWLSAGSVRASEYALTRIYEALERKVEEGFILGWW
jgi:hypothetical protein